MSPTALSPRVVLVEPRRFALAAADVVAAVVTARPHAVLGVATGRTPEPLYEELARMAAAGLDCSNLTLAALDEYVGIDAADRRSYRHYVDERIAGPLGVPPERVLMPRLERDGAIDYDERLASIGGVDLQIAGIGRNGHIGFNEPGAQHDSRTRVVELTPATRADNAEFFGGDPEAVPTHAVTQGIATILAARRILLLARGSAKRAALAAALRGPITTAVPASALQRHEDVIVVADHTAGT